MHAWEGVMLILRIAESGDVDSVGKNHGKKKCSEQIYCDFNQNRPFSCRNRVQNSMKSRAPLLLGTTKCIGAASIDGYMLVWSQGTPAIRSKISPEIATPQDIHMCG
jgi:hypothetical protein